MSETCFHDRSGPGHVFVVLGRFETVVHDAAIIPTDDEFDIRPHWRDYLGDRDGVQRYGAWPGRAGWLRDPRGTDATTAEVGGVWFVSVGGEAGVSAGKLVERVRRALIDIANAGISPGSQRVRPVVAVPVVGIEGGGHGEQRGGVLKQLLETLTDVVKEHRIDVVVVTPEPSVYAAAQHFRRLQQQGSDDASWQLAGGLADQSRRSRLALFLGAGVSIPAGLPSWEQLLVEVAGTTGDDKIHSLPAADQAQLVAQRLKHDTLGKKVSDRIKKCTRPSLAHALLAGLHCPEVVTTNYDKLYERAATAAGHPISTLPSPDTATDASWLLKMHGDVDDPDHIVLSRRDFVTYDARTKPAASVLQSLLLTRHVLFVGVSMQDDNVIRLLHEVQRYREKRGRSGPMGTVLSLDTNDPRAELWEGQLTWTPMLGGCIHERARSLEIFLDQLACQSSLEHSWRLDHRFGGLLESNHDREIAESARDLLNRLGADKRWSGLRSALEAAGAGVGRKAPFVGGGSYGDGVIEGDPR